MRIGFDVSQTGSGKAGCGFFADSLIRQLTTSDDTNEYLIYPTFGDHFWDPDWERTTFNADRTGVRRVNGHATHRESREFWSRPPDDFEERLGFPDIVHSMNFFCPPNGKRFRIVYFLHDLSFLRNPEWTTEENRIACFDGVFRASLYADCVIANSEYTRGDFLQTFPSFPHDRIRNLGGASRLQLREDLPKPRRLRNLRKGDFWLVVGTLEPRKNHSRLLSAFLKLKRDQQRLLPIVVAGGEGWLDDEIREGLANPELEEELLTLGYVDEGELHWLYQNCFAFVFPSLFEGLGLPVLEAMSCGAPVLTSNSSSLPEITGDAALLVDPYEEESIYQGLRTLVLNPGRLRSLAAQGLRRVREYSWEAIAGRVRDIYDEVLALPRRSGPRFE